MQDLTQAQLDERLEQYDEALSSLIPQARYDPALFHSLILRDDQTRRPVVMNQHHFLWHDILAYPSYTFRDGEVRKVQDCPDIVERRRTLHEKTEKILGKPRKIGDGFKNAVIWASIGHSKTQSIAIARALWELGNNPTLRIAIVMKTEAMAAKTSAVIRELIGSGSHKEEPTEASKVLSAIFPHLKRGKVWNKKQLSVVVPGVQRDYSIECIGANTSVLGARFDLAIVDDLLDTSNTYKKSARDKIWAWFRTSILSRMEDQSRVWLIGTAWNKDDVMHRYASRKTVASFKFPIYHPKTGKITWPARFTRERIDKYRDDLGPLEFLRMCMCEPGTDAASHFRYEWFRKCMVLSDGVDPLRDITPDPTRFFTGVDLAFSEKEESALTCLFTLYLDDHGHRWVVDVQAGRWTAPETIDRMVALQRRLNPTWMVETVAAQRMLAQLLRDKKEHKGQKIPRFNIITMDTNLAAKNSMKLGIARMGIEFHNALWRIPNRNENTEHEVSEWIRECLTYSPADHTGDRLMASWLAWLALCSVEHRNAGEVFDVPGLGRH